LTVAAWSRNSVSRAKENFGEVLLLRVGRCWAGEECLRVLRVRLTGGSTTHRPSEDKGAGFLSSFWTKPIIFDDADV
jgi:hypothetical protein